MATSPLSPQKLLGGRFAEAVRTFPAGRPPLILGHFDADGLSAVAILARALTRIGHPAEIRLVGKGETPWSDAMRTELAERQPGALIVADLGVREGALLPGCPTVLIDHHVPAGTPGDAVVIGGHGLVPEPTSSLLVFWCAQAVAPAEDLLWLAALGLIGDMAEGAGFAEMARAQALYGKTALRDAVSLINAPRRAAAADASPALALLLACQSPKELLSGTHPETALLRQAKSEVQEAMSAARRVAPKVRGDVALLPLSSPCQIHPLVAQQWRSRLKGKIVLAANKGYRPGWIHFAARSSTGRDLIAFLAEHKPPGADGHYGNGHRQATGGALRPEDWNIFITELGFPEERVET